MTRSTPGSKTIPSLFSRRTPSTKLENMNFTLPISLSVPCTTLAVVTTPVSHQVPFKYDEIQGILSVAGVVTSLLGLFLLFLIYASFPDLRNIPGKCILGLITALFMGQLGFLFMIPPDDNSIPSYVCFSIAISIHFCFLAVFFWTNVLAFDLCLTFSSGTTKLQSSSSKRYHFYSAYAWLSPLGIVSVALILDLLKYDDHLYRPHYGEGICWISSGFALLFYFVVPSGVILFSNIIMFAITIHHIRRSAKTSKILHQKSKSNKRLILCMKLSAILGFPWIFGYLAVLTDWTVLWYLFTIFNSLQGALLFVTFVFTKKVLRLLRTSWFSACYKQGSSSSAQTLDSDKAMSSADAEKPVTSARTQF